MDQGTTTLFIYHTALVQGQGKWDRVITVTGQLEDALGFEDSRSI